MNVSRAAIAAFTAAIVVVPGAACVFYLVEYLLK
jgi:hypothetical protein